ncbi:unnamed protein product, partial [Ixodes persulcatus]
MDAMLARLRGLADELSQQLGPQRQDVLRAELDKTERRTTTVLTTVHETVHKLETAAHKSTDLSDRLGRLSEWLAGIQDKLETKEGPLVRRLELCQAVLDQLGQEARGASDLNMGQLEGQLRRVQ